MRNYLLSACLVVLPLTANSEVITFEEVGTVGFNEMAYFSEVGFY